MKIPQTTRFRRNRLALQNRKEGGFVATVLFIALLAIMLTLATAGGMAIIHLHNEVKLLEREQIKRLNSSITNSVAVAHKGITRVNSK